MVVIYTRPSLRNLCHAGDGTGVVSIYRHINRQGNRYGSEP